MSDKPLEITKSACLTEQKLLPSLAREMEERFTARQASHKTNIKCFSIVNITTRLSDR